MARINYLLLAGVVSLAAAGCGESAMPGGNNNGPDGSSTTPDGGAAPDGSADTAPAQAINQAESVMRSSQFVGASVRRLGSSIGFATGSDGVLSRLGGRVLGGGSDGSGSAGSTAPKLLLPQLPQPLLDRLAETPAAKSLRPRPKFLALATQEENFDDMADDIEAFFKTRLFADANIESKTMTSVTYLLHGDPTCRPLPSEIMNGAPNLPRARCAADLTKLQVRIVVTVDGDGYRFQILLGPDKLELSVFIVHSDLLAWEADLAMSLKATQYANMVLATDRDPAATFPFSKLQGRVRLALKALGDKKASISWSVLEAIAIQDMHYHSFAMKTGDPVIALTGDGVAQTVNLKLAVPQTDLRAPWDPKDTGAQNTDLHVSVGGLSGDTTLSEMADEVAFKDLGLSPSFVEVRDIKILNVLFNAQNGNKMNLTVKPLDNDQVRFSVAPKFDLGLAFNFEGVASEYSNAPASYLLHETYSIKLTGEGGVSPLVVETVPESEGFDGGFKMVTGSLSLATDRDPEATVDVPQGQCLTGNPDPAEGSHPLLGKVQAAECPVPVPAAP
jgi:hypothetical protein